MSIVGWKGLDLNDNVVWEKLEMGDISGLEFKGKMEFIDYVKRMHPKTVDDIAVALGLRWFGLFHEEDVERYFSARENHNNDGPFWELRDTFGYPIFQEQMITVIENRLQIKGDEIYELADGIAKRKVTAKDILYSFQEVERETLDNIWNYVVGTASRRFDTHYATLIYESLWLLNNGCREFYEKNPIIIGKNL